MKTTLKFVAAFLAFMAGAKLPAHAQVQSTQTFGAYVGTLPTTNTIGTTDKLYILQGGVSKALQFGNNPVFGGGITVGITGTMAGQVVLAGGTLGSITLLAPPSVATPYTIMFPTGLGLSGQVLTSSGSSAVAATWSNVNLTGYNVVSRFGSMDVWQRGAGNASSIAVPASTTAYTVDGCYLSTNVNEAFTVSSVPGIAVGSYRAAQIQRNAGQTGTSTVGFGCPLDTDELALVRGNFVTISATFATGANWSPIAPAFDFICGTGTPIKQSTGYTGQTIQIAVLGPAAPSTAATRFQATSTVAVPTNVAQCEIDFFLNPIGTAGANDWVQIDDVQLEIVPAAASVASNYWRVPFPEQLGMAQRHYAKTFPYGTAPVQNGGLAGSLFAEDSVVAVTTPVQWNFSRQMRVNPSIVTFNPAAASSTCRDVTGSSNPAATVDPDTAISADRVVISCAAGGTAGDHVYVHATADAGI